MRIVWYVSLLVAMLLGAQVSAESVAVVILRADSNATYSADWINTYGAQLQVLLQAGTNSNVGIWGMKADRHLSPLAHALKPEAGFWRLRSDGHVVFATNLLLDVWWTTNAAGHIVTRELP